MIIEELQVCFTHVEFSKKGGHKPLYACGTHFIAHKVPAMDRLINRFRAYINHLIALVDNPNTKPVDRKQVNGYLLKWRDAKVLLESAYLCDKVE